MWTRTSTRDWIAQLELRIEDIQYYIERTVDWCGNNGVYDDESIFICLVMTVVWVVDMRQETITKAEVFEILGIKELEICEEATYELASQFQNLDHSEMLTKVLSNHLY